MPPLTAAAHCRRLRHWANGHAGARRLPRGLQRGRLGEGGKGRVDIRDQRVRSLFVAIPPPLFFSTTTPTPASRRQAVAPLFAMIHAEHSREAPNVDATENAISALIKIARMGDAGVTEGA